jgi:hypothetical protein
MIQWKFAQHHTTENGLHEHNYNLSLREHFKIFAGRPAALPFSRSAALPFCRSAALPFCRSAVLMPLCRSAAVSRHNEFVLITF